MEQLAPRLVIYMCNNLATVLCSAPLALAPHPAARENILSWKWNRGLRRFVLTRSSGIHPDVPRQGSTSNPFSCCQINDALPEKNGATQQTSLLKYTRQQDIIGNQIEYKDLFKPM